MIFRTLALDFIKKLVTDHGEVSVPGLATSLHELFSGWSSIVPTKSNAKTALAAMHGISVIFGSTTLYVFLEMGTLLDSKIVADLVGN